MSYFNYVQDQGYEGKKIFDKYGNFSKAFKKFVVAKKGKINLPQDWVYLPDGTQDDIGSNRGKSCVSCLARQLGTI